MFYQSRCYGIVLLGTFVKWEEVSRMCSGRMFSQNQNQRALGPVQGQHPWLAGY